MIFLHLARNLQSLGRGNASLDLGRPVCTSYLQLAAVNGVFTWAGYKRGSRVVQHCHQKQTTAAAIY